MKDLTDIFNPNLLRLVRERLGLSQKKLADELDVKQAILSKFESGLQRPNEAMLKKIASVLDYPVSFFMQPSDEIFSGLAYHRKRSSLGVKVVTPIESEVRLRALDLICLAQMNNIKPNLIERNGMTPVELAVQLRKHWKCAKGPIPNLTQLLEANSIVIIKFDFGTDKLDGFFIPLPNGLISIAVNDNDAFPPDRQRYTLAHELGHVILGHSNEFPDKHLEKEANDFAAEFLMPADDIKPSLMPPLTLAHLKTLKSQWCVSIASLVYRARELNTIGAILYRRMWMYLSKQGLRKNEPLCNVEYENPALIKTFVQRLVDSSQISPWEVLHLSEGVFRQRYPFTEGCHKMSAKAL